MTFSSDTASKAAFKKLYGKAHTSNSKDIVNESEPSNISIAAQTIFAEEIAATATSAVSDGVAAYVSIPLVLDSSSGGKAYLATITGAVPSSLTGLTNPLTGTVYSTGQRAGFFIPQYLGSDFRVILKDGYTEIPPLSSADWIFDYYAGIVTSEDNLSLSSGSVDGYIYVGNLLSDTGGNWLIDNNGDISNTNSGSVNVGTELGVTGSAIFYDTVVTKKDGYVERNFGVLGDGYISGFLGVGTTSPTTKLFVKSGDITLEDYTGSNVPSIDIRGTTSSASTVIGILSFGNENSGASNKRISQISGLTSSPYDSEAGQLVFYTANTSGSMVTRMIIDEDGYLGLGTISPSTLMHLQSSTSGAAAITLDYNDTAWTAGDVLGRINWSGNDASSGASGVRARVEAAAVSTAGATALKFYTTADSSTTLNEVLTITNDQRLGIGTSTPSYPVDVVQSVNADATVEIKNNTSGTAAYAQFISTSTAGSLQLQAISPGYTTSGLTIASSGKLNADSGLTGGLVINTDAAAPVIIGTNGSERLRVLSTGLVGIGVTSPQQALHVFGNIRLGFADSDQTIIGDGDLVIGADSDVLIVSDVNDTAGAAAADIIFGAGSASAATNASYATMFTGAVPRLEYARILGSTGYLGIGETSPTAKLTVAGSNSGNSALSNGILVHATNAVTDGEAAIALLNSGPSHTGTDYWFVGINETAPGLSLAYGSSLGSSGTFIYIDPTTSTVYGAGGITYNTTNRDHVFVSRSPSTTGPRFAMINNDTSIITSSVLGRTDFYGKDSSSSPRTGAVIEVSATATWGTDDNDAPTAIKMYVQSSNTSPTTSLSNPSLSISPNPTAPGPITSIGYVSTPTIGSAQGSLIVHTSDTGGTSYGHINIADTATNWWSIYYNTSTDDLHFRWNDGANGGYLSNGTDVSAIDFTGQHRSLPVDAIFSDYDGYVGMIVVSTGDYSSNEGIAVTAKEIDINNAIPTIRLSSSAKQKNVFGVVSDREEQYEERVYSIGAFNSIVDKDVNDTRVIVNSLGEGAMWVCSQSGPLLNGDYICSSDVPGLGMLQDDDVIHNYTVAKITMDCDFSLNSPNYISEEIEYNGNTYIKAFVGVTYHCG